MRVIALASQKGGSGKTTLAGHLAVEAERSGAGPVAVIDTDPQGSLADWWNNREAESPLFASTSLADLRQDVARIRHLGIELLIIDTPPAITSSISEVISCTDFVVIPTRPSPHDLRAVAATVQLAERLGKPWIFVINGATAGASITEEAAVALSQHGPLVPAVIHHRTDYASSMIDGRTVMELPGSAAARDEVVLLWKQLDKWCRENPGRATATGSRRARNLVAGDRYR